MFSTSLYFLLNFTSPLFQPLSSRQFKEENLLGGAKPDFGDVLTRIKSSSKSLKRNRYINISLWVSVRFP